MHRIAFAAALIFATTMGSTLVPRAARAEVTIMNQAGFWTAYTTKSTDGLDLCGIGTRTDTGKKVFLKWFKGSNKLVIQVFKPTWSIPAGVSADISVRFDSFDSWSARTVAPDRTVDFVEFNVPVDRVQPFVRSFTAANTMVLTFPGGSEAPWVLSLGGSTSAVNTMVRCMRQVNQGGDGQPYAGVPNRPSQPFQGGTSELTGRPLPSLPPVQATRPVQPQVAEQAPPPVPDRPPAAGVKRPASEAGAAPPTRSAAPAVRGDDEEVGLPK